MKIAILGAGPIGLIAALAVERNGHTPVIFTNSLERSKVNRDMFLLRPLPMITNGHPDDMLYFSRTGTSTGYATKCYGSPSAPISWDRVQWGAQPVWWLTEAYERLFERYQGYLVQRDISFIGAGDIRNEYSIVFSTIPAKALCGNLNHTFSDVPTFLVRHHNDDADHRARQELIYNGETATAWFRYSYIRGWRTWEYAGVPPEEDLGMTHTVLIGKKVLDTNCDCHPRIHRVGRWAQYTRGILNHHAFPLTTSLLATEGLGGKGTG